MLVMGFRVIAISLFPIFTTYPKYSTLEKFPLK